MSRRNTWRAGVAGLTLALLTSFSAQAAVISATYNTPLTSAPLSVSFNGTGSFLFTSIATGYGPGAWVATSGTAQVTTIGTGVTDFFAGAAIDQTNEGYTFGSIAPPQMIPYSAADDFIGLALTLGDGVHYGYAEVAGPSLVGVGFESVAGMSIAAGDTGLSSAGLSVTATPEPASLAVLATGLAVLTVRRRRNKRQVV